jgi:hypothetical protein
LAVTYGASSVGVIVGVAVSVGVGDMVSVGVFVGVGVRVAVGVNVMVAVGVAVDGIGEGVAVGGGGVACAQALNRMMSKLEIMVFFTAIILANPRF